MKKETPKRGSDFLNGCLSTSRNLPTRLILSSQYIFRFPDEQSRKMVSGGHRNIWFWRYSMPDLVKLPRTLPAVNILFLGLGWARSSGKFKNELTIFASHARRAHYAGASHRRRRQNTCTFSLSLSLSLCSSLTLLS